MTTLDHESDAVRIFPSRVKPDDSALYDLQMLSEVGLQVPNSTVHRGLDAGFRTLHYSPPETEFRLDDLTEELDRRDASAEAALNGARSRASVDA